MLKNHPLDFLKTLNSFDVVLPGGEANEEALVGNLRYCPQNRAVTLATSGDYLVSGKSARVGSRGVEREGIDPDKVKQAEAEYRVLEPNKKNVPDRHYRKYRTRPLLMLHALRAFRKDSSGMKVSVDTGTSPVVALGLSFPKLSDAESAPRVRYRVNLVEWHNRFSDEIDDDQENEEE